MTTTYNVTNSNNSGSGSLREAIELANLNPGADIINLMSDVTLTDDLKITDSVTIGSAFGATITQTSQDRIFTINDGDDSVQSQVSLHRLNLTGGNPDSLGGAIYTVEDLSLTDSELYGNATTLRGGAVYVEGASLYAENVYIHNNQVAAATEEVPTSSGGGIHLRDGATLEMVNSRVEDNASSVGAITVASGSNATITNSIIQSNEGNGILVCNQQTELTLIDSVVRDNVTESSGGGIAVSDGANAKIEGSEISGNTALFGGGMDVSVFGNATVVNSSITGNTGIEDSGGIEVYYNSNLEVINSTVTGNSAPYTGGVSSYDGTSTVTITDTVVTNNNGDNFYGEGITINTTESEPVIEGMLLDGTDLADRLWADSTNDILNGEAGDDVLHGNKGNDTLNGGTGNDTLMAGADDDILYSEAGNDILHGEAGNDTLNGGTGNDILQGDAGNDVLYTSEGKNFIIGGDGSDLFVLSMVEGQNTIADFELGEDRFALGSDISFDELNITGNYNATISYQGVELATVLGVSAEKITADNFE